MLPRSSYREPRIFIQGDARGRLAGGALPPDWGLVAKQGGARFAGSVTPPRRQPCTAETAASGTSRPPSAGVMPHCPFAVSRGPWIRLGLMSLPVTGAANTSPAISTAPACRRKRSGKASSLPSIDTAWRPAYGMSGRQAFLVTGRAYANTGLSGAGRRCPPCHPGWPLFAGPADCLVPNEVVHKCLPFHSAGQSPACD